MQRTCKMKKVIDGEGDLKQDRFEHPGLGKLAKEDFPSGAPFAPVSVFSALGQATQISLAPKLILAVTPLAMAVWSSQFGSSLALDERLPRE